ncbi:30S ribosomal protein S3 [Promethearchaeum syntrophicum]|uniref:Small ribosomal subunit protein uS3 n=1 Tax=Promethearchaeum syntrophicum TaxID=2594042 RepID=A0A5B9D9F5_9ARCH|nr:30S ribosomal protein S3 [Candidatus Prometheoarchaeum syntrophicum]QEE15360.1 30S ribosomal protein S3 [Candidatus Prometheoarchaeum syntrophicum]
MPIKKHFINKGIQQCLVDEFLRTELDNSGYSGCALQKTPMGTRITIRTSRPGLVIGKKGKKIKELTEAVKEKFNINVPTIDVDTIENPDLNAQIQAERIAYAINKGQNYRRATYSIIRRIIKSGARGVEVHISGKVTSQRARNQVFRSGVINKCGTPAYEGVDKGVAHLTLKSGVLGIRVSIMSKDYLLPDYVEIRKGIFEEKAAPKEVAPVDKFYKEEDLPPIKEIDEDATLVDDLFDEISDSKETILETDEDTLKKDEVFEELTAPEDKSEEKEEKPKKKKKTTKKKKASKKKSTKKKTSKKASKKADIEKKEIKKEEK